MAKNKRPSSSVALVPAELFSSSSSKKAKKKKKKNNKLKKQMPSSEKIKSVISQPSSSSGDETGHTDPGTGNPSGAGSGDQIGTVVKPLSSTFVDEPGLRTVATAAATASPVKSALVRRSSQKDNREAATRPMLLERVWSDADGEKILQGIIDYHTQQGTDPLNSKTDKDRLFEFMKSYLGSSKFTKNQLENKIRRLREKFRRNSRKHELKFKKAEEEEAYNLSKRVWRLKKNGYDSDADDNDGDEALDGISRSVKRRRNSSDDPLVGIDVAYPYLFHALTVNCMPIQPAAIVRRGMDEADAAELAKLECKIRKNRSDATKNGMAFLDLVKEGARLVLSRGDASP